MAWIIQGFKHTPSRPCGYRSIPKDDLLYQGKHIFVHRTLFEAVVTHRRTGRVITRSYNPNWAMLLAEELDNHSNIDWHDIYIWCKECERQERFIPNPNAKKLSAIIAESKGARK